MGAGRSGSMTKQVGQKLVGENRAQGSMNACMDGRGDTSGECREVGATTMVARDDGEDRVDGGDGVDDRHGIGNCAPGLLVAASRRPASDRRRRSLSTAASVASSRRREQPAHFVEREHGPPDHLPVVTVQVGEVAAEAAPEGVVG